MPNVSDKTNPAPAPLLMGEIRVWIASLDLEAEPAERLSRLLSDDEQKRAARFHGRRDAVRFRVHRAALRTILGECLGVEPQVVDFRYGPRGKPELAARFDRAGLRFNASHSEGLGLYAVTTWRRIGVDIERVRPIPDLESIAQRRVSPHEQEERRPLDVAGACARARLRRCRRRRGSTHAARLCAVEGTWNLISVSVVVPAAVFGSYDRTMFTRPGIPRPRSSRGVRRHTAIGLPRH